jgi:uncharacterized protein (DUF2141 family)
MNFVKRYGLGILLMLFASKFLHAQSTLTINISGLKNTKGSIVLELCDSNEEVVAGIVQEIKSPKCILTVKNLPDGKYSIRYFHDENRNCELDTRYFVIPKEGFGFSNNAKGKFGPPDYEDTVFKITGDTSVNVEPVYY